jgi:isoleucyl-tRNA synthetase
VEEDAPESVHMLDWVLNENLVDHNLEENMKVLRDIIEACARARDIARYKLRWPVREIVIISEDHKVLEAVRNLREVLLEQANSKEIRLSEEFEGLKILAKPNMKTLGPKLRGDVHKVAAKLAGVDGGQIVSKLETEDEYQIELEGKIINLGEQDVVFETELPENIVSADFPGGSVFVDTELTNEILSESMSRELIRRIQDMRKDLDLDVEAHIIVYVDCSVEFRELVEEHLDFISREVRATKIAFRIKNGEYRKEWNIENEKIVISIIKC